MSELSDALSAWHDVRRNHRSFLLTSPEGHAVHHIAQEVINLLAAEISALRDQVDSMEAVPFIYCADRDHETMMDQSSDAMPGTILRATDTLREWQFTADADGFGHRGWQDYHREARSGR